MFNSLKSGIKGIVGTADQVVDMSFDDSDPLKNIVADHKVNIKQKPYRYAVIDDFFTEGYYSKITDQFNNILNKGLAEEYVPDLFARFGAYDAYGYTPHPASGVPTDVLSSPTWNSYFGKFFDIDLNKDTITAFHHHPIGSSSGQKHSDHILCSFVKDPLPNGINAAYKQCLYEDSTGEKQPGTYRVMRAVTVLYYLNNECNGEYGGETAVYAGDKIVDKVAPVNNRLLAFEVCPTSYHSFLSNVKYPRNSITQFLHQETTQALARFNNHEPLRW